MRRESFCVKMNLEHGCGFLLLLGAVQVLCKSGPESEDAFPKLPPYSNLQFLLCTGRIHRIAPIVCVDFYERSVKVALVDGRKGQRIKIADPR
jgi:hypothetical protein